MNSLEQGLSIKPLAGQRIGMFGRGGSGKSTCTVLLAQALAKAGYSVCVQAAATMKTMLEQMHGGAMPATRHLQSPGLVQCLEDSYRQARTRGALYVLNKVAWLDRGRVSSVHALAEAAKIVSALEEGRGAFVETVAGDAATAVAKG